MKAAATKKYRRLTKEVLEAEQIETAPWKEISVKAYFFWKDRRRRDPDNAIASLKAAYDGIVDAGLVTDDDYEHMKRLPSQFSVDRKHPRVELAIMRVR